MNQTQALTALQALAHETRLSLVRHLAASGAEGLAQGDLARRLGVSASGLAFHLGLLEQAGLVQARRESRNVFYRAEMAALGGLVGYVLNDCCQMHPVARDCCMRISQGA